MNEKAVEALAHMQILLSDSKISEKTTPTPDFDSRTFIKTTPTTEFLKNDSNSESTEKRTTPATPTPDSRLRLHNLD